MKINKRLVAITMLLMAGGVYGAECENHIVFQNEEEITSQELLALLQDISGPELRDDESKCISTTPVSFASSDSLFVDYQSLPACLSSEKEQPLNVAVAVSLALKKQQKDEVKVQSSSEKQIKPTVCPICKKSFETKNIKRHERIHLSGIEKEALKALVSFQCDQPGCGKRFTEKFLLNQHKKSHIRPFQCTWDGCNASFSRNNQLKNHMARIHTHQFEFYCHKCGKGFTWKARLEKHLKHCS